MMLSPNVLRIVAKNVNVTEKQRKGNGMPLKRRNNKGKQITPID